MSTADKSPAIWLYLAFIAAFFAAVAIYTVTVAKDRGGIGTGDTTVLYGNDSRSFFDDHPSAGACCS